MAIPPEPIDEVIKDANAAVLAEVARVLTQDPQAPAPETPRAGSDLPGQAARQVVELKITSVLFGNLATSGAILKVIKPAGDYALRAGNHGPFLLKKGADLEILGRYGPDSYSEALVKAAAKRNGKQ